MARPPRLSHTSVPSVLHVAAHDEHGNRQQIGIAGEYPLTLYVDGREIITLMTLGQQPEALAIGWLRNQRLVESIADIEEVVVDWEVNAAAVYTRRGMLPLPEQRVTTSGCGQGTMFGDLMTTAQKTVLRHHRPLTATALGQLLADIRARATVYKAAGAVHACALATIQTDGCQLQIFVEDVGRHNAVDAIAGWMWLNDVAGEQQIFYTTGRLTSEMVIKCVQMEIPYLVSRSGLTQMGYEVAQATGLTMIGRAVNTRYLVFSGGEHFAAKQ